jgi:glycosyltransferase involved in cell wall biosynthesis
MKVLMMNRTDSASTPGGDTVQMQETKAALEELGVEVDVSFATNQDLTGYDLAHIFNLQRPEETRAQFDACRRQDVPVALSPILWDSWRFDFEADTRWLGLRRVLPDVLLLPACWAKSEVLGRISKRRRTQRCVLSDADVVLPNSEIEGAMLERRYGLRFRARCRVVPNAVSASFLPAAGSSRPRRSGLPDQEFVLQVARIEPVKNQVFTIQAALELQLPLVLVGEAPSYSARYHQECMRLAGKGRGVTFLGRVAHEELPPIYAAAKVHVLPSYRETPGLASLEAALAGCSIVSTDQGSAPEYFGDRAWYCSPGSLRSIREAMDSAFKAPRRPELAEHIRKSFTWQEAARRTLAAYEFVLDARGKR